MYDSNKIKFRNRNLPSFFVPCIGCLGRLGYGGGRISRMLPMNRSGICRWLLRLNGRTSSASKAEIYWRTMPKRPVKPKRLRSAYTKTTRKLKIYLRSKVWKCVKHGLVSRSCARLVGCSRQQLLDHLRSQFRGAMSFENYGPYWHIDHVIPCAKFDLSKPDQLHACFHFSNLKPEFARNNLKKADRVLPCQPEMALSFNPPGSFPPLWGGSAYTPTI